MNKLDEIKKLAEKAAEELHQLEEQFYQLTEALAPLLNAEDGGSDGLLQRELKEAVAFECHLVRLNLLRRSLSILKGRKPK